MTTAARSRQSGWRRWVKLAFDRSVALLGLVLAAPFLLVSALAVRVCLGAPVLFRQERPGRWGRPFLLVKLRTMTDSVGPDGRPRPDAERMTRLGRFLRATSLDELPQLWNVLRGELSLVGPRPLLMQYLPLYSPEQARRHEVMPGITGWAQVKGRNAISWEEKFAHDLWYVDHWTLGLDVRILLMTIGAVLFRTGISSTTHVTMPEFTGSGPDPRGGNRP